MRLKSRPLARRLLTARFGPTSITAFALLSLFMVGRPSSAEDPIDFNRDIRPILSENCYQCHGPDKNQRKADLRLDLRDSAIKLEAIVPGKTEESELIARIFSDAPDELMPPAESRKSLTLEQKQKLKQWIAEGAVYKGHWAYELPVRPQAPTGPQGIDRLVEQRLAKVGLTPSAEADRRTLIRRLFFDLVGIPPTPQEVDTFLNNDSPDAYERLVDRLLNSPHYGERMAIDWLDIVRFADTIGYHSDTPRNVWPYRDYVIRSFNRNTPFDQFTIEQLAGDLLPGSTQEQQVASCFNRLLLTTEEGGAQAKDYEARMLADRVRAVGTVWLGQTLGCCQCHDHKYDPVKAADFYSMGAFFADIKEPIIGKREPGMIVTDPLQAQERARLQANVAAAKARLAAPGTQITAGQDAWEKAVIAEASQADHWIALHPETAVAQAGAQLTVGPDGVIQVQGQSRGGNDTYRITVPTTLHGIRGLRIDALAHSTLPNQGPGRAGNGNFVLSEFRVADAQGKAVSLAHASATFEQSGFPAFAAIDGKNGPNNGWAIAGATQTDNAIVFETATPLGDGTPTTLTLTLSHQHGSNHTLGRFRILATTSPAPVRAPRAMIPPPQLVEAIRINPEHRTASQQEQVTAHYRVLSPEMNAIRATLAASEQALASYEESLPRCLVSHALKTPRTVRILPRGNWLDETGEPVRPALPEYLTPHRTDDDDRRLTRLDLARWLVSRENPLTARVYVNRLWKQFFGIGLCKTVDDLGSQGEWPANQDLLDWLACEFVDSGWDVKRLVRSIVTSRTYRQVSTASKELLTRDPENRELARQSRFRIPAELVRDNALAIAGLLATEVGGPSVKPYQPDGYWENLNFPPRQYVADRGAGEYRRGLYTWWQRSFPHPSMIAFDAPSREECAAERSRSNIPQQALVLLNDPTYVEAARVLATLTIQQGGPDPAERIDWAWRRALQRPPRPEELTNLIHLVEHHRNQFERDESAAKALIAVGQSPRPDDISAAELATWTNAARVILNLHETITRN
ncbi:Planctomycete cytochrome C [Singulisphaera sp. GP187]|uniref:PSD1 and planctomycete cytochrome C domain-containing protein n=1 Tax=Singulisphaera sp. GP187 TaxID=1882752 RepID=UPI00092686C8|nr:PSD1 and planctomycete cytochrome C domain-containing protein [Singulisphaera sp. GP187]SIO60387.1 Planctomycete cytochrome C [Singulisphaera sp. GP187]